MNENNNYFFDIHIVLNRGVIDCSYVKRDLLRREEHYTYIKKFKYCNLGNIESYYFKRLGLVIVETISSQLDEREIDIIVKIVKKITKENNFCYNCKFLYDALEDKKKRFLKIQQDFGNFLPLLEFHTI